MNRKKALELIDRGLNAEGLDKGELWKLCLYQARMLIKLVAELDKKEKYAAHLEELFGCDPAYFEPDGVQTKMKPESKPQTKAAVPEGLIDPKSYYQGYEDGINEIDLRPISWMKDCGGFTDDPILASEDGFNIPVYISKENYKKIKQRKPDVVKTMSLFVDTKHHLIGSQDGENLKLTFDGETGELKSAEVFK
jgi:hypothetical protein